MKADPHTAGRFHSRPIRSAYAEVQPVLLSTSLSSILSAVVVVSMASNKTPTTHMLALSFSTLSCAPSANTTRAREGEVRQLLSHAAAGSNGMLRVVRAESGRHATSRRRERGK